ncbi:deoxyuridine 5'-triphosphate nucleotidohydrolase-like isoform X1 [Pecten maximus]|uniref:deoxyuridine 5'-triphosphate nucleotidohydrolase-like isoform X1 n=1 Tax=Pecten maximus TaxID=6579 RepID=UPI00145868F4|nr:deoxyuridine 5'-triphosphate nucleotidohydrolase-like isoform X1 [Pecten maximus]
MSLDNVILRFVKITKNAFTPIRCSKLAAGYDLRSAYDYTIPGRGKQLVKTDIQIALPDGCYGRIAPKSGLATEHFIDIGAGVIDQDYRGNVGVVMFNHAETEYKEVGRHRSWVWWIWIIREKLKSAKKTWRMFSGRCLMEDVQFCFLFQYLPEISNFK